MNIVEFELKKYDLWREELQKKKKAHILLIIKYSKYGSYPCTCDEKSKNSDN